MKKVICIIVILMVIMTMATATADAAYLQNVQVTWVLDEHNEALEKGARIDQDLVLFNDTVYLTSPCVYLDSTSAIGYLCTDEVELGKKLEERYAEHGSSVRVDIVLVGVEPDSEPVYEIRIKSMDGTNLNDSEWGHVVDDCVYYEFVSICRIL